MRSVAEDRRPVLFAVTVLLTVLLVASVAAIYRAPSSMVTLPALSTGYSIILTANVNATNLSPGQELGINISLFNDVPTTTYVPAADNWTIAGFDEPNWPGCANPRPVVFVVVNGSRSVSEMQALGNATGPYYVCMEAVSVDYFAFQPKSGMVNVTGTYIGGEVVPNQQYGPFPTNSNFGVAGYWDYPLTLSEEFSTGQVPIAAHTFAPGQYTLFVSDEWGRTLTIYFGVM